MRNRDNNHKIKDFKDFDQRYFDIIFEGVLKDLKEKINNISIQDPHFYSYEGEKICLDILYWAREKANPVPEQKEELK